MKSKKKITLNAKKVRDALSGFSDAEMRYCEIQLSVARDAREIIKEFKITKEYFCERMDIPQSEYVSAIRGGYNYDLMFMARIRALYVELSAAADGKKRHDHADKNMTGVVTDRIDKSKK